MRLEGVSMRVLAAALGICLFIVVACKKEQNHNMVDFEQIEPDNSTNYWYIFRDEIREQHKRESKNKPPF